MSRLAIAIAAAVAFIAPSCVKNTQDQGSATRLLVVSVEPQRNILEHLVDSTFTIRTLLSRDANPETFEPSMKERVRVDSAAIYFSTGVLPFEKVLENSADGSRFVATSTGLDLIYDTHSHHDGSSHHGAPDPHYWSCIEGARTIARNMADALSTSFPTDSSMISERLVAYEAHLDSLSSMITGRLTGHQGDSFAVWHPSLSYFAREYGMNQISLGTEGKEMSAKGLKDAIDKAKNMGVKVFFFQKEFDSRQAISINDGIGSTIVSIYPLDYDWEKQLILIANEIAGAQ